MLALCFVILGFGAAPLGARDWRWLSVIAASLCALFALIYVDARFIHPDPDPGLGAALAEGVFALIATLAFWSVVMRAIGLALQARGATRFGVLWTDLCAFLLTAGMVAALIWLD